MNIFSNFEVNEDPKINYYSIDFIELDKKEIFEYKQQKGIVQVHKQTIKNQVVNTLLSKGFHPTGFEERLMRLTYNSNNWESPSGQPWKKENQGKSDIAFENQVGFGYEEWLFNTQLNIEGYQYGFIRGVQDLQNSINFISRITLFTIAPDKKRFIIGSIDNVQILSEKNDNLTPFFHLRNTINHQIQNDLILVKADNEYYQEHQLIPNIKFRQSDVQLLNSPLEAEYIKLQGLNRFKPYVVKGQLKQNLINFFDSAYSFKFVPGRVKTGDEYPRKNNSSITTVKRTHDKISNNLYSYLLKSYSENQISQDRTYVGGCPIDLVINHGHSYTLFEIKTANTGFKNIRQAVGQLLEYSLLSENTIVKKIIIVGSVKLKREEKEYLFRLKENLKITLEYWAYMSLTEAFEIQ
ncbi:hypothetical protein [Arcticibacterium luteifluviistationis]|uniref:hypothetical protein n=1 Tax=Arcticibacterium luteifluviistationis TaxID=1784714 RepID=UPI0013A6CA3A|nr:hypothetical protein [Arcticibacterium luteifluviistationis]